MVSGNLKSWLTVILIVAGAIAFLAIAGANDSYVPKINSTIDDSKAALEWINEIRVDNGSAPIEFDERAYWLALHQCKDMEEYNYYYHVNPETLEWTGVWKTDYGFEDWETPVDNLAGSTQYTYADYNNRGDYDEMFTHAINAWINSPNHYENLINPCHYSGALVIYRDTVVFIGVNDQEVAVRMDPLDYNIPELENRYWKGY